MATGTHYTSENKYSQDAVNWWAPYNGDELFAGQTSGGIEYRIYLKFSLSTYQSKVVNGMTLNIFRFSDGQAASKTWQMSVASSINSNGTAVSVAGTTTSFSFSAANAWKAVNLNTAQINALKAGNQYLYFWGATSSPATYAGIRPLEYSSTYKPYITVNYSTDPVLSTPEIEGIPTIYNGTDVYPFNWTDSTDAANVITSAQIQYNVSLTYGGGTYYSNTTAAGVSNQDINVRGSLRLAAGQYFVGVCTLNVQACYFNGTKWFYSPTTAAYSFWVDYRIWPSTPTLAITNSGAIYENQNANFSLTNAAVGNAVNSGGGANALTYYVEYVSGGNYVPGTTASSFSVNVGQPCVGTNNYSVSLRAKVIDSDGLESGYSSPVTLNVLRYRAPTCVIANIERTFNDAIIHVKCTDTGFGGSAATDPSRIYAFQESYNGTAFATFTDGITNSLERDSKHLGIGDKLSFTVAALVIAKTPGGESQGLASAATPTQTVYDYQPGFFVWRRRTVPTGSQATYGISAAALVVGSDYNTDVNAGCAYIQNSLMCGAGGSFGYTGTLNGTIGANGCTALELRSAGSFATDSAVSILFHRPGTFATYLGLDTDNVMKIGGYSMGGPYTIWHAGNFNPVAVNADMVDSVHATDIARGNTQLSASAFTPTFDKSGIYHTSEGPSLGLGTSWHHIIHSYHAGDGYSAEIAMQYGHEGNHLRWRNASSNVWPGGVANGVSGTWYEIRHSGNVNISLWTGSWTTGAITVPNTGMYRLFQIIFSGIGTPCLASKHNSGYIRGGTGWPGSSSFENFAFAATFSGDTWTWVSSTKMVHTVSAVHAAQSNNTVIEIIGII